MCEGDAPRKHYADSRGVRESPGIMIIRTEIAVKGRSCFYSGAEEAGATDGRGRKKGFRCEESP